MQPLHVVGGPEERRGAAELEATFKAYHEALHEIKQLEPQMDELFAALRTATETLKNHGVRLAAEFDPPMQAALERWRATRPRPETELPTFIERPRG